MSDIKDFQWTDESVKEMIYSKIVIPNHYIADVQRCLDEFKKSKEKDIPKVSFEIVSFLDEYRNIVTYQGESKHFGVKYDEWIKGCLNYNYDIIAVRRIYDGEIFNVNDVTDKGKIYRFEIRNKELLVGIENSATMGYLNQIEKVKPKVPLFTTDKNEPVYYMDKYWVVDNLGSYKEWFCAKMELSGKNKNHKYFLTEQEADEYILQNKPIEVSYKELKDYFDNNDLISSWSNIKSFFKSKINV